MTPISLPKLYELTKTQLGQETAELWMSFIDAKVKTEIEQQTKLLATKDDLANQTKWIIGVLVVMIGMIIGVNAQLYHSQEKINKKFESIHTEIFSIASEQKLQNERITNIEKILIRIEEKLDKK